MSVRRGKILAIQQLSIQALSICSPQITVPLLIFQADLSTNTASKAALFPLCHCWDATLVRAQLSIMMYDSLSAVSLVTHPKWRHNLVFLWINKNSKQNVFSYDCFPLLLSFAFTVCCGTLKTVQCKILGYLSFKNHYRAIIHTIMYCKCSVTHFWHWRYLSSDHMQCSRCSFLEWLCPKKAIKRLIKFHWGKIIIGPIVLKSLIDGPILSNALILSWIKTTDFFF